MAAFLSLTPDAYKQNLAVKAQVDELLDRFHIDKHDACEILINKERVIIRGYEKPLRVADDGDLATRILVEAYL